MNDDELRDKIDKNIICRLCLNVESDFISIDSSLNGTSSRNLIEKFNLLNINDEIHVTSICSNCTETLLAIQNFYLTCQNASMTLQDVLTSNEAVSNLEEDPALVGLEEKESDEVLEEEDVEVEEQDSFEFLNIKTVEELDETSSDSGSDSGSDYQIQETYLDDNDDTDESRSSTSDEEQTFVKEGKTEEEATLSCKFCDKKYKRQVHLDRHQENAHKEDEKNDKKKVLQSRKTKYIGTCNLCGKKFTRSNFYDEHVKKKKCVPENPNCRFCKKQMESIQKLEKHLLKFHPAGKQHGCPICFKNFPSVSNRNTHIQSHNQEDSHFCDYCNRGFKSLLYLKKHLKARHTKSDNVCKVCDQKFDSLTKYEYHLKSHNPNKKYKCDYCIKSFLQHHHLENHIRVHTNQKPFVCETCGKNFKQECNFKLHLKIHTNEKNHECATCGKKFIQRSSYSAHLKTHSNEKNFLCNQCGKGFALQSTLNIHVKIHGDKESREFKCQQCDRSFVQAQQFQYHNYQHHGIGGFISKAGKLPRRIRPKKPPLPFPYICNICNKSFKVPSSLAKHVTVHSESRKHICTECGCGFKRAEHLRIHVNGVHLKQKLHVCTICNRSFAQAGDKNLHMKKHEETRDYNCKFCDKTFKLLKARTAHLRIHSGERPHICGFKNCNESFMTYTALANHTLKHQEGVILQEVTNISDNLQLPETFVVETLESQNINIETIATIDQETVVELVNSEIEYSLNEASVIASEQTPLIVVPSEIIYTD